MRFGCALRELRFRMLRDDAGSAVAEFVMVAGLLTVLTLSVIQLALALHIRNTVIDAAAEGARYAALADSALPDGVARTRDLITVAIGAAYARDVTASYGSYLGPSVGTGDRAHSAASHRARGHRGRAGGDRACRGGDAGLTTTAMPRSSSSRWA